MKTFILACLLALTAVSGTVILTDPAAAHGKNGGPPPGSGYVGK
jgi:hypothetical protein